MVALSGVDIRRCLARCNAAIASHAARSAGGAAISASPIGEDLNFAKIRGARTDRSIAQKERETRRAEAADPFSADTTILVKAAVAAIAADTARVQD